MNDEELKRQLEELQGLVEVVAKAVADHQVLTIRMMAHQQAHLAAIRDVLTRMGEDRTMLGQRLEAAYRTALGHYRDQLEAYRKSGDLGAFVQSLVFPDQTLGN
jgi:hypothetical protein